MYELNRWLATLLCNNNIAVVISNKKTERNKAKKSLWKGDSNGDEMDANRGE